MEVINETLSKEIPDIKFPNILYAQTGEPMLQEIMRRKEMTEGPQAKIAAIFNGLKNQGK